MACASGMCPNMSRGDAASANLFGFTEAKAAFGVSPDEIAPALHPDDRPEYERWLKEGLYGRDGLVVDCRVRGRGGTWRGVVAFGRCLCDSQGRPVQYLGVVVEIDRVAECARNCLHKLADSRLEARDHAIADSRSFITRLVDVALTEVGFALAKREMDLSRRH